MNEIASARSYKNRDEITVSPATMGDVYEEKVRMFFNEHLHEDEEIRYILDGEGFFDVRDCLEGKSGEKEKWVRIRLEKNDLIILPAGIWHRFTTDDKNVSLQYYLVSPTGIAIYCVQLVKSGLTLPSGSVYQSHAPFQGRAKMDTIESCARVGGESSP